MTRNLELAQLLYDISELLEITGENPFKIKAYARAARVIENIEDIEDIASQNRLEEIPGIGKGIAEKIKEYLRTGKIEFYEQLKEKVPEELHELLRINGIGAKTVQLLNKKLGIKSISELEEAARHHRLRRLEGFGATKEENIIKAIERYKLRSTRIPLSIALPLARDILNALKKSGFIERIEPAGSLRRKKESVGDIDILAISEHPKEAIEFFVHLPVVKEVLGKGSTKATIVTKDAIQVDLRIVENRSFGTSLQYFTGSKEHNIKLREIAKHRGLKLSEYEIEDVNTGKKIYFQSDDDVYTMLGLEPIPPELREDTGEIEAAAEKNLPKLVELKHIKGDFHVHTNWSEGKNSIEEMVMAAKKLGYEYIAVTDHSKSLGIAHGLSERRLLKQMEEIQRLNDKLEDFHIFTGVEVDIKADATLDLHDNILAECDVVVAALHVGQKQTRREIMRRLISAMENENVDIIAHPTGRIIGEREAYDVDIDILIETAASTNTVLEINAHPRRLDLNDVNARKAKSRGVRLAIGTDAHNKDNLELMEFGVNVARRGWLEKKDVINTKNVKYVRFKD